MKGKDVEVHEGMNPSDIKRSAESEEKSKEEKNVFKKYGYTPMTIAFTQYQYGKIMDALSYIRLRSSDKFEKRELKTANAFTKAIILQFCRGVLDIKEKKEK